MAACQVILPVDHRSWVGSVLIAAVIFFGPTCLVALGQTETATAEPAKGSDGATAPSTPAVDAPVKGGEPDAKPSDAPAPPVPPGDKPPVPPDGSAPKPESAGQPQVIRRQDVKAPTGDNKELDAAALGEDGRVAFQFRNQTWPELIDWLAELSGEPLDWLELPADRVNITTPGRYTVDEVIDLFNRHLLSRGYTLLKLDGGLSVVKCAGINPAVVPRLDPEALAKAPPHSFVRVSFEAGWLSAEKLAAEFTPMISGNGKLTALSTTNRIEAMDAAISLRQIGELLRQELDAVSRESLAPEFKLRHIPAEEAKLLLEQFLGVAKEQSPALTPEQMQMQMQMKMQMQMQEQQLQQQSGKPPSDKKAGTIAIVANPRQNSILIQAPPDRVAIATEFLKRIDVPGASMTTLADVENRVEVFRLVSLDPAKLIDIIQEMNVLEPSTRIRVDAQNKALIVSGSAADRYIIRQVIARLDGSGRSFEVLQLRRLDAAEVAESIGFLMGKTNKEKDPQRRRYYGFFDQGNDGDKPKEDEFRVAANTRFRQVLLWANTTEMDEVRNLLVKLGELPPPDGSPNRLRVIEAEAVPETLRYLEQLRRQWEEVESNPIELPPVESFRSGDASAPRSSDDAPEVAPEVGSEGEKSDPAKSSSEGDGGGGRPAGKADSGPGLSDAATSDPFAAGPQTLRFTSTPAAEGLDQGTEPEPTAGESETPALPKIRSMEDFDRAFAKPEGSPETVESPGAEAAGPQDASRAASRAGAPDRAGDQPATRGGSSDPIRIEVDPSGNLVLSSKDPQALDRLEGLMLRYAPPRKPYHTFYAKHVSATWIKLNLEDFFKEDDKKKDDSDSIARWIFDLDTQEKDEGPAGLGKSNKLRFVDDIDTGTIVVRGATPEQLKTIEELIRIWDVPEPVNDRRARFTKLVTLRYARAEAVAETIKETYRDLLSGNDKAFQQAQVQPDPGAQNGRPPRAPRNGRRGNSGDGEQEQGTVPQGGPADPTFKGKLSIGVDAVGNTLLLSAEGEPLLELISDAILQLDQAARSADGVQITNVPVTIRAESLENALKVIRSATPDPKAGPRDRSVPSPPDSRRTPKRDQPAEKPVESPEG